MKHEFNPSAVQEKIKALEFEEEANRRSYKIDPSKFMILDKLSSLLAHHCYSANNPHKYRDCRLDAENLYNIASAMFELFRKEIEESRDRVEYPDAFGDVVSIVKDDNNTLEMGLILEVGEQERRIKTGIFAKSMTEMEELCQEFNDELKKELGEVAKNITEEQFYDKVTYN